jgi:tripeptide aminopeptidase
MENAMIDRNRLAATFMRLTAIDSVSKEEGTLARELKTILESFGAETFVDSAGKIAGSNTGNLIAKLPGSSAVLPLLLNAHMDTVPPGKGVKAVFDKGIFSSDGDTILGADDKSAIAILIEVLAVLQENNLAHGLLEIVFTICEEIGLLGAKHLDYSLISAEYGYTLDATDTEGIILRAPAANRIEFKILGKDAHAGSAPEKGINAIWLASKAIAAIKVGRIDRETTCNIGVIEGGIASNVVPDTVTVKGEVRSHDPQKLAHTTTTIVNAFEDVIQSYSAPASSGDLPDLEIRIEKDFSATHIPENHRIVTISRLAAENLGRKMVSKTSGGGADANIFFEKGIMTGVLGTGMRDVHTVRETVGLDDMERAAELLLEIIKLHADSCRG